MPIILQSFHSINFYNQFHCLRIQIESIFNNLTKINSNTFDLPCGTRVAKFGVNVP